MRVRTHPGEILLEEFLKPMDITPHALAIALGVPATRIADIVHQRRAVTGGYRRPAVPLLRHNVRVLAQPPVGL